MKRRLKQVVYGSFYIIVLAAIATPIYFFFLKSAPSCFDTIQNQQEEGVDCGGPCAAACIASDIKNLTLVDTPQAFSPTPGIFEILAKVQNPNLTFAAASFSYRFRVYTSDRSDYVQFSGQSHLYAGEVQYLPVFVQGKDFPNPIRVTRIESDFFDIDWVPISRLQRPALSVREFQTSVGDSQIRVDGVVANRDAFTLSQVPVIAIYFGRFGQVVGFGRTLLDNLAANENRPFTIIHPQLPDLIASSTQVIVIAPARR